MHNLWRSVFWEIIQGNDGTASLKNAAQTSSLQQWTKALTAAVVATSHALGWRASAVGHKLDLLPVSRSEYLALDVVAFADGRRRWRFPTMVAELENSRSTDRIAYSLWKVLSVRADLRIVFCYRRRPEDGPDLVRFLESEVVQAMELAGRVSLDGETVVVVGSTNEAEYFPYGFFKWWQLDAGTGKFHLMP